MLSRKHQGYRWLLHGSANIWSLSSIWKKYFNLFFHEKINFICSSQRVIFFLLHRYECFKNKTKLDKNDLQKCLYFAGKTSEWCQRFFLIVRIWKICHSYPGCSFIWILQVAYFTVKHLYLCNKLIYVYCVLDQHEMIFTFPSMISGRISILFQHVCLRRYQKTDSA